MDSKSTIYIDQNIIQYIYERKLELKLNNKIIWVYSDEHFGEINRHNDENQCFEVLEYLKAQKIKILLDDKFKTTDKCFLFNYDDPRKLYQDYLDTIEEYKHVFPQIHLLQAFFNGNAESLNIDNFIEQIELFLESIIPNNIENNDSSNKQYHSLIETSLEQFKDCLHNAKSQIQPLDKIRKMITKKHLSDIDHNDGAIFDQIWLDVKDFFEKASITKEQLFGKEKLPFFKIGSKENKQSIFDGIIQCHTLLNQLGYWPDDKLIRSSKIFGINSDASHIAHGFFCDGILSADDRLCKKAKAIYEYYGKIENVFQLIFDENKKVYNNISQL